MDVDFWGVVNGIKVFLLYLIVFGDGYVINIFSVFGLFLVLGQVVYNLVKFVVCGFIEVLCQEMVLVGYLVKVMMVYFGGVKIVIVCNVIVVEGFDQVELVEMFDKWVVYFSLQWVVQIILMGVVKNKVWVLVGVDVKVLDLVVWLIGFGYQWIFLIIIGWLIFCLC